MADSNLYTLYPHVATILPHVATILPGFEFLFFLRLLFVASFTNGIMRQLVNWSAYLWVRGLLTPVVQTPPDSRGQYGTLMNLSAASASPESSLVSGRIRVGFGQD